MDITLRRWLILNLNIIPIQCCGLLFVFVFRVCLSFFTCFPYQIIKVILVAPNISITVKILRHDAVWANIVGDLSALCPFPNLKFFQ